MLRNYLAAAIRNLFRNRAYAAINIFGLALGFTAVILIALFLHDEYSYDRAYPAHDRIYRIMETLTFPGQAPVRIAVTSASVGGQAKLDYPEIETATRLTPSPNTVRRGAIEASIFVYWADANFFSVFPLQARSGDANQALSKPDGLVITRKLARRFFARDDVVGETLELTSPFQRGVKHVMRIGAVLEDLPSNTHLDFEIIAPGIASFSEMTRLDAIGVEPGKLQQENVYTYVRLRPGARPPNLEGFAARHLKGEIGGMPIAKPYTFSLIPLTAIHLQPPSIADMKAPGDSRTLQAMAGVALLILFVAGSNFVSMMTARAARRAVEVGVRKAVGATRQQIIVQFLGECLFYTALALALAMLAVEWLLPSFNAFLQRDIAFDYLRDPMLGGGIVLIWIVTSLASGAYAALVLSMFRPSAVLKGVVALPGGSGRLRQGLVIFQFGTLIALIVSTLTIQRQTQYAMNDRLRLPTSQIYLSRSGCPNAFRDGLARIPGVLAATCSSGSALTYDRTGTAFSMEKGGSVSIRLAQVDYGFFELFGVKPLVGRLFARDRGEDDLLMQNPTITDANPSVLINESAARALGYASPAAAVNQYRGWGRIVIADGTFKILEQQSSPIIGVVPDFSVGSVRDVIEPTAYYIDPIVAFQWTVMKLDGNAIPEALGAARALWARSGAALPFDGLFLSQRVNELYADIRRQSMIFSVFAGVAVVVAALGLLGLAVFTAERRTREIGLRKVMGASRTDILRFLGWQFARPVLWANLIAWPAAYLFLRHWLEGFAYHIDMNPLLFVLASGLALVVALATVCGHALLVARAKPVEALRYE